MLLTCTLLRPSEGGEPRRRLSARFSINVPPPSAASAPIWPLPISTTKPKIRGFLADALESRIIMPLDVCVPGQMEAVFDKISKEWGKLDFVVHSIAFAPDRSDRRREFIGHSRFQSERCLRSQSRSTFASLVETAPKHKQVLVLRPAGRYQFQDAVSGCFFTI